MYQIQLEDLKLTVDEETYNNLQDENYANSYLAQIRKQFVHSQSPGCTLWKSSKKPTSQDHEATVVLLSLRKSLDDKFNDKKICKNTLWDKIAVEMNRQGFYVGEGTEGQEKVRQKFANLQKSFVKVWDRRRRTGEGYVPDCPYYTELQDILGDKHKINPPFVLDSIESKNKDEGPSLVTVNNSVVKKNEDKEPESSNRFIKIKTKIKPQSARNALIEELLARHKQSEEVRKQEFESFVQMFKSENEKRHVETMALIAALKPEEKKSKKRKRGSDTEESD